MIKNPKYPSCSFISLRLWTRREITPPSGHCAVGCFGVQLASSKKKREIVFWITMKFLNTFWFQITPRTSGQRKRTESLPLPCYDINFHSICIGDSDSWYSQTFMWLFTLNAMKSITARSPLKFPSEIANFTMKNRSRWWVWKENIMCNCKARRFTYFAFLQPPAFASPILQFTFCWSIYAKWDLFCAGNAHKADENGKITAQWRRRNPTKFNNFITFWSNSPLVLYTFCIHYDTVRNGEGCRRDCLKKTLKKALEKFWERSEREKVRGDSGQIMGKFFESFWIF